MTVSKELCTIVTLSTLLACGGPTEEGVSPGPDTTPTVDASAPPDTDPDSAPRTDASPGPELDGGDTPGELDSTPPELPGAGLEVGAVPESEPGFAPYFDKHVGVFGLNVFGTAAVPDEDILHAAAVLAQYLDNDEDGEADDPAILLALQQAQGGPASMVMFATEWELESSGIFDSNLDERAVQDLYATETHPGGSSPGVGFDATLEEVLHLVTHHGWATAYPADFAEEPGTTLTNAMDVARGGQFINLPDTYPEEAWYHYDDATCTYDCMATEYLYWALTSLLGAQGYPGRCAEIEHEWELCSPEAVQAQDTAITALLQGLGYDLPTVLPDGTYEPTP